MARGPGLYAAYAQSEWHTKYLIWLAAVGVCLASAARLSSKEQLAAFLTRGGVAVGKVARAVREIERKTFHLAGVLIPLWYQIITSVYGWSDSACVSFAAVVTAVVWGSEVARLYVPAVQEVFLASPFGKIMRDFEQRQFTGTAYYMLGCLLSIALFPRDLAIVSILYLVLGDMTAALVGVSFGGDALVLKRGRAKGSKSVEGSLGMFAVCFLLGHTYYWNLHLNEYVAFVSALAATLTELWSERVFHLNDNITIPLVACVAQTWAFHQLAIAGCDI